MEDTNFYPNKFSCPHDAETGALAKAGWQMGPLPFTVSRASYCLKALQATVRAAVPPQSYVHFTARTCITKQPKRPKQIRTVSGDYECVKFEFTDDHTVWASGISPNSVI